MQLRLPPSKATRSTPLPWTWFSFFSLLVIGHREAVGFLIFDWRNGESQNTTSSVLYVLPQGHSRRQIGPGRMGAVAPARSEGGTGCISGKFSGGSKARV